MNALELANGFLNILHQDEHYLIVNKPAGLFVLAQDSTSNDKVVESRATLRLLCRMAQCTELYACHVLDRRCSGVLVLAKSRRARDGFFEAISNDQATFRFVAACSGFIKAPTENKAKRKVKATKLERKLGSNNIRVVSNRRTSLGSLLTFESHLLNTRRVRESLQRMHIPAMGDSPLNPTRRKTPVGRVYLHVESIQVVVPSLRVNLRASAGAPPSFRSAAEGPRPITDGLSFALSIRLPRLVDFDGDVYRLADGREDGLPGLLVNRYGDVAVMNVLIGRFQGGKADLGLVADWCREQLDVRTVYVKNIPRDRSHRSDEELSLDSDANPLAGPPADEEFPVVEYGVRYLIRPCEGYQVGMFIEHRENRRWVAEHARDRRVLNMFAYTCTFSVAAAKGGATSTANVDLSVKCLEWGKRNFQANNVPLDNHRFYRSEAFDFIRRANRQKLRFDMILLDPPTFSRQRKSGDVFQVERDMVRLLKESASLIEPDGLMLVSVNHHQLTPAWIREQVETALRDRRVTFLSSPPAPFDTTSNREGPQVAVFRVNR